ncbi:hypothetical protein [Parasitella parasitica]|uniref:AAA+ ATPase domain-containing protein n=1 Tax=Parasitella parasitica TaxID=35722 RepID=A0A0B7NMM6_9FUNG|nr:hypothetical protein [Parasitella parasitica]
MSYPSLCYGEEGARLSQAFQLTFEQGSSPAVILLAGDSGTGKSFIIQHLANVHNATIYTALIGELAASQRGQLGKGFKRLVWEASASTKSVVLIEDLDLFFPRHGQSTQDPSLAAVLESLIQQNTIMLVATTRRPDHIALDVRTLFQDQVNLQIPTPIERKHMMYHVFKSYFPSSKDITEHDIERLSSRAHAFVAADLAQWIKLAEEDSIINKQSDGSSAFSIKKTKASTNIRVSGLQSSAMAEKPDPVHWHDIGGLVAAKNALEESAVWVYKHADAYKRLGIRPSKGVLLYGPPGTGKTLLAKAVATESSANFLPVSIPDLVKGHVGESEKAVSRIFQTAIRCSPCVIFLDELEAIFSSRESSGDLGATNHPESIDSSILRPGRLDRLVYVGAPTAEERFQILQVLKLRTKLDAHVDLQTIALKTKGYTGADLQAVIRKAGLLSLKKQLSEINQESIELALSFVGPSIIPTDDEAMQEEKV